MEGAAEAGALLSGARNSLTKEVVLPEEKNIIGERPRIGVFVCHCGINIGGVVDVPAVRDFSATLPYVEFVSDNLYSCSQDTQDAMTDVIEMQTGLKEVVEIGENLGKWQQQLGFDTSKLEGAITNIRTSMEKVNTATNLMTSSMDAAMTGGSELSEMQDSLRSELLAELSTDTSSKDELSKKIESEMAESE